MEITKESCRKAIQMFHIWQIEQQLEGPTGEDLSWMDDFLLRCYEIAITQEIPRGYKEIEVLTDVLLDKDTREVIKVNKETIKYLV